MKLVISEDFKDLELNEFPYDRAHSALGEYHYLKQAGVYGNWYDPISLHQWRSLDGSWLITSDGKKRFLEQNRGDNTKGAFANVYCCLVNKKKLYAAFTLEFDLRIFEVEHYCGMAFNYLTSRVYDFIGIKGNRLALYHREEESFFEYAYKEFDFVDLKTYHFKLVVGKKALVYLDGKLMFEADLAFIRGRFIACVAKSACRYSNIKVVMEDSAYKEHLELFKAEEERLALKCLNFPKLQLLKKINLMNFGSGRQLRIRLVDGKPIFLIAQHQKRMIRDSFARLSCLTCFDYNGNVLWQKGEPNNCLDNTLISCDLPFQIADINNDGKYEVIYSMDFEIIIADLLTGNILKSMPTPIIKGDELVKNEPFYRLNVDAIRVADFRGLGYKGDFIIKDRYQNVWAYDSNFNYLWRYHHKNTGHFPYIADFDNDGKDEMFVGYDMIDDDGKLLFSLPMNSDHTDEIIYARLNKNEPKKLILASGNEGMNIINMDGSIYKHNEIGHAQRISVAKYNNELDGLQIMATAFWGSDGIICLYDSHGNLLKQFEQMVNGNVITPINYDGKHILAITNASSDGGLLDGNLDKVVLFPEDGHPTLCVEAFDLDDDGIDEIICFDSHEMWIYKASSFTLGNRYLKYSDDGFSNYRGEYLLPLDYE